MKTKILLGIIMLSMTGCSSFGRKMKNLMGGRGFNDSPEVEMKADDNTQVRRFSDESFIPFDGSHREYSRTTREKFEQSARVQEQAGSLWVMEGQDAYLFSENTLRLVGDIVNVQMTGAPKDQLEKKAKVIRELIERVKRARAGGRAPAKDDDQDFIGEQFSVKVIPSRIVDKTVDGNYRIKGSSSFMIERREYRVIVTGVVRPRDISDKGVSAPLILDPKFDIVSVRREVRL